MKKGSKKLTAMEAIDLADYWIKEARDDAGDDFDWAVHLVLTYVRGYSRQNMIIQGIRLREKQAHLANDADKSEIRSGN